MGKRFTLRDVVWVVKREKKEVLTSFFLRLGNCKDCDKKKQLKQENQRKLFEKLLFMTIRPEFNNGGAIEAVSMVLFKFL